MVVQLRALHRPGNETHVRYAVGDEPPHVAAQTRADADLCVGVPGPKRPDYPAQGSGVPRADAVFGRLHQVSAESFAKGGIMDWVDWSDELWEKAKSGKSAAAALAGDGN